MRNVDVAPPDVLFLAAARGDREAFARLVERHHAAMCRVAFVISGDAEMTRDAVQSAWLIAWRKLSALRDPQLAGSWLVAIAANEARQALRRRRRTFVVDLGGAGDPQSADPAAGISGLDLQRALGRLKPEDRMLLALRYVAGFDATELAGRIGGTPSGIRTRLARIVERMRRELEAEAPT